ncbi:hypothetical protein BIFDEN_00450 [Bifidobacterium dentium ATCC 27678]|nr:hypothetical protein BIFDEN_00450 [Bifidobacterium dentium ATCC 27678]
MDFGNRAREHHPRGYWLFWIQGSNAGISPPFRGLLRTILQTGLFRMSCMNAGEMDTPAERSPEACMPLIPADEDDRKIHPAAGWS